MSDPVVDAPIRIHGRDVTVTCNGVVTNWEKLSVKVMKGKFVKNAADAAFEQKTQGRNDASGTLTYIMGGDNTPGKIPAPGTEISDLAATVDANEEELLAALSDEAQYGKCRVESHAYELQDEPGTMGVDIGWGYID